MYCAENDIVIFTNNTIRNNNKTIEPIIKHTDTQAI